MGKQWKHPEQQRGEVFLTNIVRGDFRIIGYESKRMGRQAYDIYHESVDELIPVFVSRKEYARHMGMIALQNKEAGEVT